ncbi:MAG: MarR family transcriptional regulator [Betaproteobacteria bacterium]|nr:MarR family transcriptional regulator [Betaproteobacteria bacterium]
MSRKLKLRIASAGDALDAFEVAWHRAAGGGRKEPEQVLAFAGLPLLLATLTPARWALLRRLREAGPLSVNALARLLARDYKNVHTDVKALETLGLIGRDADGLAVVEWDIVTADLRLQG